MKRIDLHLKSNCFVRIRSRFQRQFKKFPSDSEYCDEVIVLFKVVKTFLKNLQKDFITPQTKITVNEDSFPNLKYNDMSIFVYPNKCFLIWSIKNKFRTVVNREISYTFAMEEIFFFIFDLQMNWSTGQLENLKYALITIFNIKLIHTSSCHSSVYIFSIHSKLLDISIKF